MAGADDSNLTLEGLVHDLNNVFQTISEAADVIAIEPHAVALAATIQRSVERGRRLVAGLCESGSAWMDLDPVLDRAIEAARDFLETVHAPQVQFVRHIDPGIRLQGIPAAWERVMVNLFLNAAQAMRQGGSVEISARQSSGEVEITVADSGPGIAQEILPEIFKPHFSTKSSADRTGLGLHIVETIVKQSGGAVSAENRSGTGGALFRITVPATCL